jgi:hypothetical protein
LSVADDDEYSEEPVGGFNVAEAEASRPTGSQVTMVATGRLERVLFAGSVSAPTDIERPVLKTIPAGKLAKDVSHT